MTLSVATSLLSSTRLVNSIFLGFIFLGEGSTTDSRSTHCSCYISLLDFELSCHEIWVDSLHDSQEESSVLKQIIAKSDCFIISNPDYLCICNECLLGFIYPSLIFLIWLRWQGSIIIIALCLVPYRSFHSIECRLNEENLIISHPFISIAILWWSCHLSWKIGLIKTMTIFKLVLVHGLDHVH